MKRPFFKACLQAFLLIIFSIKAFSQIETLSSGSFIINMGATNPNTIGNGLKPYGLIYDVMKNHNVPVKWVISQSKVKDGADFNYNGVDYKGGTFIIPAEFRNTAVNAKITSWIGQGVVGVTTTSPLTVDVTRTLKAVPKWTLDAANGSIAQGYLTNAGITLTTFPGAYNFKAVTALDCCDDFFVMPHADPTWATHGRLFSWNKDCLGSIWAACHAVSALENSINPANATQQMNFLSTRTVVTTPTPWPNNSLKLWGTHSGGTIPYTHQLPGDPVAQYMGATDAAQLNGSEQIYIPKQAADVGGATRWNPGAKIIAYDPTQADVPLPDVANGNAAAVIVYGRGFDDVNRGFVMYEAGHTHNKGSVNDVAAQRAFLNFSFFQVQPKAPQLTFSGITGGQTIAGAATITGLNVSASSPLAGISFTYQWSSSCGGSFSSPSGTSTNFTAPVVGSTTSCVITCVVTDNCGRASFQSFPVTILGASPPTTVNDAQTIDPGCGAASVIYNLLLNDTEPDGQPMTLTNVTGVANGTLSFNASGSVTYTSNTGFVGVETLTYTVCDNSSPVPACSNGTYTITVGNAANLPNAVNDAFTIAEDNIGTFNVLANDLPVVSGPITVSAITSGPANGKISINTDNTITYVPNADFAGTDNFTYRVVNTLGYSRTATVTVTVTNDACDGGTYQTAAGSSGSYSGNPNIDTYLRQDKSTRNYGSCGGILVDGQSTKIIRGLLRFNLAAIPSGATITNANLRLVATAVQSSNSFNVTLHPVTATSTWVEGTQCDADGVSNWTVRTGVTNWTAAGGDFGALLSTTAVTTTGTYNWNSASMNTTISGWINNASNNQGFLLKFVNEASANEQKTFGSLDNTTSGNRPLLTFDWSIAPTCASIPVRAPLGNQDTATTISTSAVTFNVLSNDNLFSQPATALSISTAPIVAQGTATANLGAGTITFTPNSTFNGVATFQYTVTTANGSDIVRVYVRVNNSPVDAVDDNPAGQNSGVVQTITVLSNDNDPEGAALSVTIVTQPANGTATVNGSNQVVYTPNAGFTGTDALTYQVCEPAPACGTANCDIATVNLIVLNRTPTVINSSKTILPCFANTISLLSNASDPENGALTITNLSAVSPGGAGTVVNNNDGTVTLTPTSGLSPLPAVLTFTYTVRDNGITPQTSAPATVTVTVLNPVNTNPVAVNDVESTNMEQNLFSAVKDNDSDPENQSLTNPTITIAPLHGTATVNPVNGLIQYTPNPGYSGTDVLTYQICDIPIIDPNTCTSAPDKCATATLTITVVAPNNVVGVNDQNSTWINTAVSGTTLTNDFDPQLDLPLISGGFIIAGTAYTSGIYTVSGFDFNGTPVANAGSLTIYSNGTYTYTPATDFTGIVDIPYFVDDSNPNTARDLANLRITVNPFIALANSVIANNDENILFPNASVSSTLFTNDTDPQGNSFTVTSYLFDTNGDGTKDGTGTIGSAIIVGGITTAGTAIANAGTITINADGTYTFTPATDFSGLVEVSYTITDNLGAIATATLILDVLPDINGTANNNPFAGDDFKYTNINTTVSGNALSNSDSDPNGDAILVSLIGSTVVSGATTVATPHGSVTIQSNGTYSYTPTTGYIGPDQITYTICDNGSPSLCTEATLYFLTGGSNTTSAINDENSTWQDVNVSGGVVLNDYDAENNTQTFGSFLLQNLTGIIVTGATLSGVDKTGSTVANAGTLSFDASGNYTFDPATTFTGSVLVPYKICDNGNLTACDTAYLLITIDPQPNTGINTLIANDDENISYGAAVSSTLFYNDKDPQNDAFTVTLFRYDSNGDGLPDVNAAPGTVTVAGVSYNGDPVANAGSLTINANGTYTYTPAVGFVGKIDVPYIITDALGASTGALLHIDVLADANGPGNDAPFAGDDFAYTTINLAVTGTVLSNDSDPNSNGLSVTAQTTTLPGVGTLVLASNGSYTFTPVTGYVGPATFTYQVCDVTAVAPQPLCADAVLHVLVGPGININGKVWDDANGNVIDAGVTEPETNAGNTLYVNLVNGAGNVVATSAVAADGTYSFTDITPGISYSLVLSTTQGTIGNAAPAASLPAGWIGTGENRNGTIDLGTLNVIDNLTYGFTNTVNFDFGIEQLPNAAVQSYTIPAPALNSFLTLNGTGAANSPAQLSGTDPEDGAIGTGNTMTITSVPTNAELYYDFGAGPVLLSNNTSISNYDPSKLQVKFTTLGSQIITFSYSITDAAGKADPSAATYTINLLNGLPVEGLSLSANLSGTTVALNWKTLNESNTSYFEVERSTDNRSFGKTGNRVSAAGSSVTERLYKQIDDIKDLQAAAIVYYRIKLTDADGKISYSNVAAVRISKTVGIKAWPNPFVNSVQVQINSPVNTEVELRVTDVEGRTILVQRNQVIRGNNQLSIENLQRLPAGTYLLEVINKSDLRTTIFKLTK